jgi:hypothetical protein
MPERRTGHRCGNCRPEFDAEGLRRCVNTVTEGTNAVRGRFAGRTRAGCPEMADSELVAAYRLNAANCTEMAKGFADLEHRIALLDMAQAWLRLAEITETLGEVMRNIAAPPIMPSGSGHS